MGSLGNMARDYGLVFLSKDTPWFALCNELGGLAVLLGLAITLVRRYALRPPGLRPGPEDLLIPLWLGAIALSGFLVEAVRFLSEPPPTAGYSFLGYGISRSLPTGAADRMALVWWLHAGLSFALIAYLPYSKLLQSSPPR